MLQIQFGFVSGAAQIQVCRVKVSGTRLGGAPQGLRSKRRFRIIRGSTRRRWKIDQLSKFF